MKACPRSVGARYHQAFYSMTSHNMYQDCFQCSKLQTREQSHGFYENFAVFSCTKEEENHYGFQLFFLVSGIFVHLPGLNQNDIKASLVFKSHVTRKPRDQHVVSTQSFKKILNLSTTDFGKISRVLGCSVTRNKI